MFKKIINLAKRHKIISVIIIIALAIILFLVYKSVKGNSSQARYVLAAVEKGTIVSSVSGSGQVSASNQVDIKPKASGEVVSVNITNGQYVPAETILFQIDDRDAQKSVRDAEVNYQRAKLNLEKMRGFTTSTGTLRGDKEKANDNLQKSYDDGFNTVSDVFLNLPAVMSGLNDTLFDDAMGSVNQWNIDFITSAIKNYNSKTQAYRDNAYSTYQTARTAYDKNLNDYKTASRFSEDAVIESLINQTYDTTKDIAEAIKSANNLFQVYKDELTQAGSNPSSLANTYLSSLSSYTSKTNSYLLSLLSIKNSIQTYKETLINVDFDIADQEINVQEAANSLQEAKDKLSDYSVVAPFNGVIAKLDVAKGDTVSSGSSPITFITTQRLAEITLNEVDAAKVKVGQKTTLTFDAVSDLTLTGKVAEIDTVGTVSQGVVSYTSKIVFDMQDQRVKPGMSVSAEIITDTKTDVLMVANSAIKTLDESSYVELPDSSESENKNIGPTGTILTKSLTQKQIQIGISNDEYTEITSGLNEGDIVVSNTISSSAKTTTSANGIQGGGTMFRMAR